ncbi:hypothetical protein AXX17_AT5G32610 [Arabidopsis thaliana]|uniref:Uncharacterized protein n=1 Tax=Arabidopsis thaliana TaxID=3702 RepID=A0A178UIV9_ARATH|nr:hypothetical protein AXX17_AT5G32610 [Arabidopsis thaliana]
MKLKNLSSAKEFTQKSTMKKLLIEANHPCNELILKKTQEPANLHRTVKLTQTKPKSPLMYLKTFC